MGTCKVQIIEDCEATAVAPPTNVATYDFLYVVGKGGFGKVWKVQNKKTKGIYAMKAMSKARIIAKKSVNSVLNE
jgi:serine/threonine protein kinase